MTKRLAIGVLAGCITLTVVLAMAGGALAAFPGTNGKIAFVHDPGAPGSNTDIFAIDPTGQNRTPLTSTSDNDFHPAWSADGEKIVFDRYPAGGPATPGEIWVMNHDGTGQTRLSGGTPTTDDSDPAFSADGRKIVFDRFDGSSTQIWIMNADGSGQTQLTFPGPAGDHSDGASFSPDGQKIVFGHFDGATGYHGISVMNADGSGQAPLTVGSATVEDFAPNYSPDGQRIAFDHFSTSGAGDDNIFVINADGSGLTPVTNTASDEDLSPAFSPQGTQLAFERDDAAFTFGNIFLADSNGLNQGLTPLGTNAAPVFEFEPDWQPLNPPDCELTGKRTSKSVKSVSVTVTCASENATVVAEGSGKAPKVPNGAVASKAKKFKIPPVTMQVPANTATTLKLKISKKGQQVLKKAAKAGKKSKATITATLTDDLGQSSNATFKVKFKAKKK